MSGVPIGMATTAVHHKPILKDRAQVLSEWNVVEAGPSMRGAVVFRTAVAATQAMGAAASGSASSSCPNSSVGSLLILVSELEKCEECNGG